MAERKDLIAGRGHEDPLAVLAEAAYPERREEAVVEAISGAAAQVKPPDEPSKTALAESFACVKSA
jgi:hypothetical protein